MKKTRNDFDTPWKQILQTHFRSFMEFCFPEIAEQIDWSRGYESLDKELHTIAKKNKVRNRIIDKLMKVWNKNEEETWILIHIEVQGQRRNDFEERMFVFAYRLFDKYKKPIVNLAILTDNDDKWRPNKYRHELFGCSTEMNFLTIKLLDYKNRKDELAKCDNPFGLVILAHLESLATYGDTNQRFQSKIRITRLLYEHGWNKEDIVSLYLFIDGILALPEPLELEYQNIIENIEEEKNMQYMTRAMSFAAANLERTAEAKMLLFQLNHKFTNLPAHYREKIQKATQKKLKHWAKQLLDAKTLDEVFL